VLVNSEGHQMRILPVCIFPLVFVSQPLYAQQVDCSIQVNYENVSTTNKDFLVNLEEDIRTYVNDYSWGSENLEEKVRCTMNIHVQGVVGENRYSAQVFVGSQRKIYGTEESSAVLRLFDETWEFTYVKNRPISHNAYSFNDLASFLDFYVYLVLGYDYDSYEKQGGNPHFQKASDIASLGRASGQKGWQQGNSSYSRLQLIGELLNPKFVPVRIASYHYHFDGLDSLTINPPRGLANMLTAVERIGKAKKEIDPRNIVIKTFFDTKSMEIADKFFRYNYPDPSVYIKFSIIDPSHQTTYEEYRQKKR